MIPVTKPFLPNREKLDRYIDGIYEREWLTNNGPLVQELTRRLENYLGVKNILLVSNGTLALQIAYRALGISGQQSPTEAITTPFTFVATASSLKWEGVEPIFVDVDPETWCLDPSLVEAAVTPRTRAIVPVHVFGNACDIERIDNVARKHNLKVVYDAAHAFDVKYKGRSLLTYGDAATLSFHATKVFHSIEGGAIVFKCAKSLEKARRLINFGLKAPEEISAVGINSKMNEFQAAMGLCVLDEIEANILARRAVCNLYERELGEFVRLQKRGSCATDNGAYFPIVLDSVEEVHRVLNALKENSVVARRYFYPSLDVVPLFNSEVRLESSNYIAERVICLPIYVDLGLDNAARIAEVVKSAIIN